MQTTAAGLSRALQVLAYHPDVQNELRAEITASRVNGDLDYNALTSLPLLDAVCRETLRMYPPVAFTLRTCVLYRHSTVWPLTSQDRSTQEVILPLSRPVKGKSGTVHTSLRVPKDVDVCVGIVLANKDKALWGPDADEWRPKRWLEPMPSGIQELPGIYNNMCVSLRPRRLRSCVRAQDDVRRRPPVVHRCVAVLLPRGQAKRLTRMSRPQVRRDGDE